MSTNSQASGSFEDKMQDISQYLKSKVVDPAEAEKDQILAQAESEKKRIIDDARAEADRIIEQAKKKAELETAELESALRIASRQAVNSLKIALENEVLTRSIAEPAADVLSSEEVVKQCLTQIIDIYLNRKDESVELVLSEDLQQKLSGYLKNEIKQKGAETITVADEAVPSGFSVKLSGKQLVYDFSQESLMELLSQYLRPELRKYLFSE